VGIHLADQGKIEISDTLLCKENLEAIRKKVGFVFQNSDDQLFMSRVYDDIAFGPRNFGYSNSDVEEMVSSAVKTLDIEHLVNRMPHKLSGGEKRNVALASVLSMDPDILLLDEPSSFLDPKSRRNLINVLKELSHTKIIATHDLDLVLDVCERVIILRNGEVIVDGDPKRLLTDNDTMEKCGLEIPLSLQYRSSFKLCRNSF